MPITTSHHDPQARSFRAEKLTDYDHDDIAEAVTKSVALALNIAEESRAATLDEEGTP